MKTFERAKGLMLMASFTRAITRALAGAGTEAVVRGAAGDNGGGVLGFLAGMLIEGVMVATDVPDTRSWSSLPGRMHVFRVRVPAGVHEVKIALSGLTPGESIHQVEIKPGGYAVVTYLSLR